MTKDARIQKIEEIVKRENQNPDGPYGKVDIPWEDALSPMAVYKIPLEYLVYNKYNGRILSRTKSLETEGRGINAESEEGRKLLEKLLFESNLGRNKQTLESITKMGQEKVGIITRDGIIIDGNRRAMLLSKAGASYFKTVVLNVTLEENPLEIEKLETTYQMGEDEKLSYNPIEKYLKVKGLSERGVSVEKIATWMGETIGTVKEYLDVMKIMDDYLDYLGYNGIYTQLDGREDQFINLTKWLLGFYEKESEKGFDHYKNTDVDDLKIISYDYIRIKYEGKDFRNIAYGHKENHFFGDKQIWESFRDYHFEHVEPVKFKEEKIHLNTDNFEAYLKDRDTQFFNATLNDKGRSFLDENIEMHSQQLRNKKSANEPLKLVSNAIDALTAINQKHPAFSEGDVMEKVEAINEKTFEMLKKNSPENLLAQVIRILGFVDFGNNKDQKDELLMKVKDIGKIAYQMEKNIKDL
ncbi:MAG: hypothetical protein JWM14_2351 [Chitinophagaceae bacterium]|nr:hypothetical protein [Chitinophagaceae bacterium]